MEEKGEKDQYQVKKVGLDKLKGGTTEKVGPDIIS